MKSGVFSSWQGLKLLAVILLALGGVALLLGSGSSLAQPFFSSEPLGKQSGFPWVTFGGISGTVTAPGGAPLADVRVTAYVSLPSGDWEQVRQATTDAAGRYAIVPLDTALYRLRFWDNAGVYAFEYYSDALSLEAATDIPVIGEMVTGINASLSAAGYITGTISMFDGQPPDWAQVNVYQYNGSWWDGISYGDGNINGGSMSYSVGGLASGVYRLRVEGDYKNSWYAEYYDDADDADVAQDVVVTAGSITPDIDVVLGDQGGRIAGTATSAGGTGTGVLPQGAPLQDIRVTAYLSPTGQCCWDKVRSTVTDVSGTFHLTTLGAGAYAVRFLDPQGNYAFEYYSDAASVDSATPISLSEGVVVTGVNASLSAAGYITGTISMFDGQPPDWAQVNVYQYNGSWWDGISYGDGNINGGSMSYSVGGLASGVYRLRVEGDYKDNWYAEYYDNADDVDVAQDVVVTAGSVTPDIDVVLGDTATGRITGTVWAAGQPQAGIRIDLYQDYDGYGSWWRLVYADTDAQGHYSIGGLKDARYKVRFSDPGGAFATVFYDGQADFASADVISLTHGATVPNVNVNLTGAGAISGTVSPADRRSSWDVFGVVAYRYNGATWEGLGTASTDAGGQYVLGGLLPGDYRIYFFDTSGSRRPEYYDNVRSIADATDVTVMTNTVTANIDAVLEKPALPLAQISSSGGSVIVDPWTGQVTIMSTQAGRSDTTISTQVDCVGTGAFTPTNVMLWMGGSAYPMTETPPGSGVYQATIPANDLVNATLRVSWSCGLVEVEKIIGDIVLYDPSGYITDAESGAPVAGASVTLYKVPNWLPDTSTETFNCRTVDTRSGPDWSSEPDAEPGLGMPINPELDLINGTQEISPAINPLVTDAAGHYGWDVAQGCWYVAVQAAGYQTRISPVVGVPPEVTDLNLVLTPLGGSGANDVYLPLLLRFSLTEK